MPSFPYRTTDEGPGMVLKSSMGEYQFISIDFTAFRVRV